MRFLNTRFLIRFMLLAVLARGVVCLGADQSGERVILTHYMPWYQGKPVSPSWGWHWTMDSFNPDDGGKIASHYTPLIGPYDSADADVIEYHLLTMRMAGIDGVVIDWYGREGVYDYAIVHRNAELLIEQVNRLGMRFAICYEDQTLGALVDAGRISLEGRVDHVASEIEWMAEHWFSMPSYARLEGKPVLMSFGYGGLNDIEWRSCLESLDTEVAYFSEHRRRSVATGAFDWPNPSAGVEFTDRFARDAELWPYAIPAAFPRFVDIYEEAGVHASWGRIEDNDGATFRDTLDQALSSGSPITQVVTWNDWGEGTMVEPSVEFGYRDLRVVQELRKKRLDSAFSFSAAELKLPLRLLELRKDISDTVGVKRLDEISEALAAGEVRRARKLLKAARRDS